LTDSVSVVSGDNACSAAAQEHSSSWAGEGKRGTEATASDPAAWRSKQRFARVEVVPDSRLLHVWASRGVPAHGPYK
jgi:hypothetical protein